MTVLVEGRWLATTRGERRLLIANTYAAAAWLRGEAWPEAVAG